MNLREKMLADLRLRGYRPATVKNYIRYAARFAYHYMRSPRSLGKEEVRAYLLHLLEVKQVSPSLYKMHLASLKFLYRVTLEKPEAVDGIPWPRVPRPLPDILSREEAENLIKAIDDLVCRAVTMTVYAGGLRINEACSLCVEDMDSSRGLIHIRNGKGGRDRYVMLGERLLKSLRKYWCARRPPGPELFPGHGARRTISAETVRHSIRKAAKKCGIKKRVTPHILRYSFATHMIEYGEDIRTVQLLLGHRSIATTAKYIQLSRRHIAKAESPFERIPKPTSLE